LHLQKRKYNTVYWLNNLNEISISLCIILSILIYCVDFLKIPSPAGKGDHWVTLAMGSEIFATKQATWHWTHSNVCFKVDCQGAHTIAAYSSWGHTY